MGHFMDLFDHKYLGHWDVPDNGELVLTIKRVLPTTVPDKKGGVEKKALIYFVDAKLPLLANITNCRLISGMYGKETKHWKNKRIALIQAVTTNDVGQIVDCIRVRPTPPSGERPNRPTGARESTRALPAPGPSIAEVLAGLNLTEEQRVAAAAVLQNQPAIDGELDEDNDNEEGDDHAAED